jgi:hypothetical protein
MKPHEPKTYGKNKREKEEGKQRAVKTKLKRRKDNKMLSQ